MSTSTAAVEKAEPLFSQDQLAGIKSFDDMMQVLADAGIQATEISEYGDGFVVENNKASLVNVPFGILDYKFSAKGNFGEFVIARVVCKDGRKLIVTDGSSGMYAQSKTFRKDVPDGYTDWIPAGIMCPKGVTVSEYEVVVPDDKTGEPVRKASKTFYFGM